MLIRLVQLQRLIARSIVEGGLKLPPSHRSDLTPAIVRKACAAYLSFIGDWNAWLEKRGEEPVNPVGPSGSSAYAEADETERPETIYGDVDYLVSFPVEPGSDPRKAESAAKKKYTELMTRFITMTRPRSVDVGLTLNGVASQVIMKLDDGVLVQVDTVMTHPNQSAWMKGRYVPERGIKGYVTGNLYKALGDYLTLTIGTEGVLARTKDGQRVGSNVRAGVGVSTVSTNFNTFLLDIARFLAPDVAPAAGLKKHPGMSHDNVNIADFAQGIVGLADTLAAAGLYDRRAMLDNILDSFERELEKSVEHKVGRNLDDQKATRFRELNDQQLARVAVIFGT